MSSRIKSVENKIQKSPQHGLVPCSELEKSLSMDPADVRAEPNLIERCFILMVANLINLYLENAQRKYSLTEKELDVCGPVVGETLTTNDQASMNDLMIQMANYPSVPLRLLDRAREPSLLVAESQKGGTIATFRDNGTIKRCRTSPDSSSTRDHHTETGQPRVTPCVRANYEMEILLPHISDGGTVYAPISFELISLYTFSMSSTASNRFDITLLAPYVTISSWHEPISTNYWSMQRSHTCKEKFTREP
ncbi:uncharacterized protein BO97DRAFT_419366 [Aspergillus homomorphus CBS 101889]|uniref:Uncharacterized protein n=1 Tax=Aspergillus homomorphus (strain CBS 101889) TaxID=1450537 RepID=A0A395HFT5_ASPHC|nr:hypothetical protein BO97DRAFT_419366 [Aspergillus homomorphus CBS 101889]RAL06496.1 hypothetical protein BO97DRAFT_419366 [Aspergillus homomorphus CBS 101889]